MSWRAFLVLLVVAAALGAVVGGLLRAAWDAAGTVGAQIAPLLSDPAAPGSTAPQTIEAPIAVVPPAPAPTFALTVRLRDDRSGEAARSWIRLWRFGVEADDEWTAGDRMVRQVDVPPEGAELGRFPPGRYRVQVLGACKDAEDPPEVRLEGDAEHLLDARFPKTFPAYVVVFDESGRRIEEATLGEVGFECTRRADPGAPSWVRESERHDGEVPFHGGAGVGCRQASGKTREIRAGPEGFLLGDVTEASRTRSGGRWAALSFPGRSSVHVLVQDSNAGRGRYVAVAAPLGPMAAHVLLPDGLPAVDAGATVSAVCRAEFLPGEDVVAEGIDLPIEVTIRLDGFRPCSFVGRVGDPPPGALLSEPRDRSAVPRSR